MATAAEYGGIPAILTAERERVAAHLDDLAKHTAHAGTRRGLQRGAAETRAMTNPQPDPEDGADG